jgi:hypothetical protein
MNRSLFLNLCIVLVALLLLPCPASAQNATQTVVLRAGWNSVWLEVEPLAADGSQRPPQEVFSHPSIEMIATPKPMAATAEYFADAPGALGSFNREGWQQWNRTDAPGSSDLSLVFGHRPYLIRVAQGASVISLSVSGRARFFRPSWTPDRYNLVGFGLAGSRSFNDFFSPSGTRHSVARIFRLAANGNWQLVNGSDTMVSNEAYWIYSDGPSDYMGPVAVTFERAAAGRLDFAGASDAVGVGTGASALELDLAELTFSNLGAVSATPEMELVAQGGGVGNLALFTVNPLPTGLGYSRGAQVDSSLAAGSSALGESVPARQNRTLTVGAQRNWNSGAPGRINLYRLRTSSVGASVYLPVTATLNEQDYVSDPTPLAPAADRIGLWVGEISVDSSTSVVENGSPMRGTAAKAPARIILHYDGSRVRLLSQVTLMQTKTADASVPSEPVLVLDPARVPFFEGIRERNGRRVGLRIESVAFDMPRKLDATSQAALINDSANAGLDAAGIPSFLVSRQVRPPALREVYALSLDLQGTLGASGTLTTVTGSLHLDPFHRSNPFRHPYHQQHSAGPFIYRDLRLVFDASQPLGDVLRANYSETIRGLINSNLSLSGRVELRRVSKVALLDSAP